MSKRKDDNGNKRNNAKLNELKIFEKDEFGKIRTIIVNGEPYFIGKDVADILEYSNTQKAIRDHVDEEDKLTERIVLSGQNRSVILINESGLYSLILSSNMPNAKKFKHWVTSEILPTIRKTGGYVNNDALFIDTYLPFADENTKLLFSATLETVRKQNELIKRQQEEITHKQEVINGLTDDIDIYKKRVIINRICKRRYGNYANRYKELYKCYRETFHINLEARCEGYNLKQVKKKDQLTVIGYAEKFGFIDDLYSCCVKLYETEVNEIIEELRNVQD